MNDPKIVLIHATRIAIEPVEAAFKREWPQAQTTNLLDDSLAGDLALAGRIDERLGARFQQLVCYAQEAGACGVLFTCSAFGPAIEATRQTAGVPVLKPNEAMFDAALSLCAECGHGPLGLVSTFAPSVPSMREELLHMARQRGLDAALQVACPDGALAALQAGHMPVHDDLVEQAALRLCEQGCSVVMLGQFSMAHVRARIAAAAAVPVLASPDSAVRALKSLVQLVH